MPHIKERYDVLIVIVIVMTACGLWFLFRPETYWQRVSTLVFCALFLAFVGAFIVYYTRYFKDKPDVSE